MWQPKQSWPWRSLWTAALLQLLACENRYESERAFLELPTAEQHKQFRELAAEQQVRVYLAASASDPTNATFCPDLREQRESALPAILLALSTEKDDGAKLALLRALSCVRDERPIGCDPRLSPIALTVAKSIVEKSSRDQAVAQAQALRCP